MIKPLPGYVLVEPLEQEEVSSGGVYLPEASKDKPMKGKIVKKGDNVKKWAGYESFEEGNTVIYKKWTNQEVQHEGKSYLLVSFNELLAVIG